MYGLSRSSVSMTCGAMYLPEDSLKISFLRSVIFRYLPFFRKPDVACVEPAFLVDHFVSVILMKTWPSGSAWIS